MAMKTLFMRFNKKRNPIIHRAAKREIRYGGVSTRFKGGEQRKQEHEWLPAMFVDTLLRCDNCSCAKSDGQRPEPLSGRDQT